MSSTTATSLQLSNRIKELGESATLKMTQAARDLAAKGKDVISLSVGQPDFDTPSSIKIAAKKALDEGKTKYTPVNGVPELREAICKKLKRDNSLDYTPDQIVVSAGAKHSIYNIFQVLLNPGDEVIVFTPYWVSYEAIIQLAGGVAKTVSGTFEEGFIPKVEQVVSLINENTKAIIFSTPCNPTGVVIPKDYIETIAKALEEFPHVAIVSDEIYEYINYSSQHFSIAQVASMKERTFLVNGMSKGYAMTGWRIGYVACPELFAKAMTKFQGQVTSGVTSISQYASIEGLLGDQDPLKENLEIFRKRKNVLVEGLKEIQGIEVAEPQGAFYVFPKITSLLGKKFQGREIETDEDLALYILERAHISTVAGSAFGMPGYLRISYAIAEDRLREALSRLKQAVIALQ